VNVPALREINIVPFRTEHGAAFYALNRAWLDEHGLYGEADEVQLADPVGTMIVPGGAVFVALRGDEVVGTAAVVPHGVDEVELAKLMSRPTCSCKGSCSQAHRRRSRSFSSIRSIVSLFEFSDACPRSARPGRDRRL
jgi:hypothetical protein